MKRTLYSLCIGAAALSLATVQGEDNNNTRGHRSAVRSQGTSASTHASARSSAVKSSANIHTSGSAVTARSYRATTPQTFSGTTYRNHISRTNPTVTARSNVAINRDRSFRNQNMTRDRTYRNQNAVVTHDRTYSNRNFRERNNVVVNRDRNVVANNNFNRERFSGRNYAAFRDYHRSYHDRGWWRSHYNRIVFVFGSPYYWDAGYWYPAWGYDPYASYPYDGPIYAYNNLTPDQVVVDVQTQLQRDGYYAGPIDGSLGPMTRSAIAAFQADHGLAVTSAIDEPTLSTLGVS